MPSLDDVCEAVKTTLETNLTGVTVYPEMPGQVNVPAVVVQPTAADFEVAMGRGTDTWLLSLVVLVAKADDALAQKKLRPYVDGGGSSSIRKVVFSNKTLGLSDTNAHVSAMANFNGQWDVGGYMYAGAALTLVVHVKPD